MAVTATDRRVRHIPLLGGLYGDGGCSCGSEVDLPAARQAARILVAAEDSGRPSSLADAQIAGICLAGGYELATRNVGDFAGAPGLTIINPFD